MLNENGKKTKVDAVAKTSGSTLCVFVIPVSK